MPTRAGVFRLAAAVAAGAAAGVAAARPSLMPWPTAVRAGVVGAVAGKTAATTLLFTGGIRPRVVGALAGASLLAAAAAVLPARKALAGLQQTGARIDPCFTDPPTDPEVSCGPGSVVDYATVGREGARFLWSRATRDDIEFVTGAPPVADAIRVFVGVRSAPTVDERVALAIAELKRTGAFDRSVLIVQAPAGTGFANPTPLQVVENLTRGDCASVAVGYGLLPSFLSLGKVSLAALTQRTLLEAVHRELAGRTRRPRLLLYGESLGARVQQAALIDAAEALDHFDVDRALWVGTPGGQMSDALHASVAQESTCVDRPEQIDPRSSARVWFLEHDGDPVVHNRPRLMLHRPDWLAPGGARGRGVPPSMTWLPGITWLQVLVDTFFATNIQPGRFESVGHDYRADLGAVVAAAYDLRPATDVAQRLEERLRSVEIARAAQIGTA